MEIPLHGQNGIGRVALIDDEDAESALSFKWYLSKTRTPGKYYAMSPSKKRGCVLLHRLVMNAPEGTYIDHINGDGLDNRKCNLRLATNSQNHANVGKPCTNTSGYKGVVFNKRDGRWYAQIKVKQKGYGLGCFDTPEEAARAYDALAREHFGEFARLNFPNEEPKRVAEFAPERSSRFRGVSWIKRGRKWQAGIKHKGKSYNLGWVDDEVDAAMLYDAAAKRLHGDKARLNFPA